MQKYKNEMTCAITGEITNENKRYGNGNIVLRDSTNILTRFPDATPIRDSLVKNDCIWCFENQNQEGDDLPDSIKDPFAELLQFWRLYGYSFFKLL